MINNQKKNNKKLVIGLFFLFSVLLGTTLYVSFSTLLDVPVVKVKSIHAVYDPSSDVVMKQEKGIYEVIFNDKIPIITFWGLGSYWLGILLNEFSLNVYSTYIW